MTKRRPDPTMTNLVPPITMDGFGSLYKVSVIHHYFLPRSFLASAISSRSPNAACVQSFSYLSVVSINSICTPQTSLTAPGSLQWVYECPVYPPSILMASVKMLTLNATCGAIFRSQWTGESCVNRCHYNRNSPELLVLNFLRGNIVFQRPPDLKRYTEMMKFIPYVCINGMAFP